MNNATYIGDAMYIVYKRGERVRGKDKYLENSKFCF